MSREEFKSRLGFLLVSAGCAIGIGNVWKFPYIVGENGGGVFVLLYLVFLFIIGIPVLTMELAVGRASRRSTVKAFKLLQKKGHKWHIYGWVSITGCLLLMMYYTTVSGWMLGYFIKYITGTFENLTAEQSSSIFSDMLANPAEMLLWMGLCVFIGLTVCSMGLQNGIERITKVMMVGLLMLIVILAIHSLALEGATEGLKFYLLPDFGSIVKNDIGKIITSAMTQAFFTLSIGIASMEIFGSYMSKDHTLTSESIRICFLDTFVAVISGLIIFPACFSFGIEPDSGPSLIFVTLPKVFSNMTGGRLWGGLFFLFMSFAGLSTIIAVFENIIASSIDNFGWSRKKSTLVSGILLFFGSIPCVLGYNIWSDVKIIGDRNIPDSESFAVGNLLLPVGALVYLFFCVTKWGWGFDKYIEEANTGSGIKMSKKLKPYFQFFLPGLITAVFISGLI